MRLLRNILLVWMVVWLPIAGGMAAVMPIAGATSTAVIAAVTGDSDSSAQDAMAFMPCHGKAKGSTLLPGQSCSHCVLCHLAGALVTASLPEVPTVAPTHLFAASPIAIHPSFVPELLVPPPRTNLA